jgi:hypothetical protein
MTMSEYEQIVARAKEQDIDLEDKYVLIPRDENRFSINGDLCFGRVFEDTEIVVLLRDVEEPYSETGFIKEPFIYRIVDKYRTYLSNGTMAYLVEFYVIE